MAEPAKKLSHVAYEDVNGDGVRREVVIVKRWGDGSYSYIDTQVLDYIDKGRLKAILLSQHADKYEMFELLNMTKLNNGMNALDYFHQLTKIKRVKGSVNVTGGGSSIMDSRPVAGQMPGSEFTNPGEAKLEGGIDPAGPMPV